MVKKTFFALVLIAVLAPFSTAASIQRYSDEQIFAQAEEMSVDNGWLPTNSIETAPSIDPGGQIIRTTVCSWLYGRPKTNSQRALVICEYQIKIVGMTYISGDGTVITNNMIITSRDAPQIANILEQMTNPKIMEFRQIAARELQNVQSMTFIASRSKGVEFPTPEQFKP